MGVGFPQGDFWGVWRQNPGSFRFARLSAALPAVRRPSPAPRANRPARRIPGSVERSRTPAFRASPTSAGVISIGNTFTAREFSRPYSAKPREWGITSEGIVILKGYIVSLQQFSNQDEVFPRLIRIGRSCGSVRIRSDFNLRFFNG